MTSFFKLLEDGGWHSLQEIAQKTKTEIDKLKTQCQEAAKKGFIEYDADSEKARLSHNLMSLLLQLNAKNQTKWEKKAIGTATIPAGKAFQIQGLYIQNQTEKDLEITFTFNPKPKEIIIQEAKT